MATPPEESKPPTLDYQKPPRGSFIGAGGCLAIFGGAILAPILFTIFLVLTTGGTTAFFALVGLVIVVSIVMAVWLHRKKETTLAMFFTAWTISLCVCTMLAGICASA